MCATRSISRRSRPTSSAPRCAHLAMRLGLGRRLELTLDGRPAPLSARESCDPASGRGRPEDVASRRGLPRSRDWRKRAFSAQFPAASAGARSRSPRVTARRSCSRMRPARARVRRSPRIRRTSFGRRSPCRASRPSSTPRSLARRQRSTRRRSGARGRGFEALIERETLRSVLLASLLIAAFWGAAHALTPGHGKALVAAYLVGTKGTPRHAFLLGGTVTIAHTAGVRDRNRDPRALPVHPPRAALPLADPRLGPRRRRGRSRAPPATPFARAPRPRRSPSP